MSSIAFIEESNCAEVLNPMKGFAKETQTVVQRRDPLLGHVSIYNPLLKEKVRMFVGALNKDLLTQIAADTRNGCFFCPEKVAGLSRFPPELVPDGMVTVGETTIFPNMFALAKYHIVAIVSHAHYLELTGFTPELLNDAFTAFHRFVRMVFDRDHSIQHVAIGNNYLFPAGASLVHPHFQALLSPKPYSLHQDILDACLEYYAKHNKAYHVQLVQTERTNNVRYIAQTGAWHWLTPFAPIGINEILGIHESACDFSQLSETDLLNLAKGLAAVLRLYASMGNVSFNFMLYSTKPSWMNGKAGKACNLLIRVLTRQNPYPNYRSDDFFLQKCLQTELIVTLPEDLAKMAKSFFQ